MCKSVRDAGRRLNSRKGSYSAVASILLVICLCCLLRVGRINKFELPLLDLDGKLKACSPRCNFQCVWILPLFRQCSSSFDAVHDHGLLDAHVILVVIHVYYSTKVLGLGVSLYLVGTAASDPHAAQGDRNFSGE